MEVASPLSSARPLSILYVITKASFGGAQRYVYDLATGAQERGLLAAVAVGGEGELIERLEAAGVPVFPIGSLERDVRLHKEVASFLALVRLMRRVRPDVVHTNSSKAGGLAALAARLAGVRRIVFTAHGWAFNEMRPQWQKALIALFHYATVLLSHRTICNSEATRRDIRWMPFVESRLSVIHPGIGPLAPHPRQEARRHLEGLLARSLPEDAFWIGTLAELHPIKGLDVLVRAFARIAHRFPQAVLVFAGAGAERARLDLLARELAIDSRLYFCGHVAEAPRYLGAFDTLVLPSRSESFGYALLEAGRAEVPVIASRVGGIPEIVQNETTGLLTPPGDEHELARSLGALIEDGELRGRLARELRARVASDFSIERMLQDTFTLYTDEATRVQEAS